MESPQFWLEVISSVGQALAEIDLDLRSGLVPSFIAGLTIGIAARWAIRALTVAAGVWLIFEMLRQAGAV